MNQLASTFLKVILGIALLSAVLNSLSFQFQNLDGFGGTLLKLLVLVGFVLVLGRIFNFSFIPFVFQSLWEMVTGFFRFLLLGGRRWEGARYMGNLEAMSFFKSSHKGFVIDGAKRRLSQKVSYQSLLTVGGMGKGKSTVFVMPNLYTLDNCSMVVTDTSGEIFQQTSGYLASKGFDIQVLNLMDVDKSMGYNPLDSANTFTEIQQIAHLLIKSSPASAGKDDVFWNTGAEKILRILIQCLKNKAAENPDNEKYVNLANVKYLLNNFDAHLAKPGESKIDKFIMEATMNDASTWNDYKGFTTGNEKTMLSFLSTADTALTAIGNPELAALTASNQIDFQKLRERKSVLYVMVRQQDLSYFAFLLNLFYTDLFRSLLSDLNHGGLPVNLLLDEFGQLTIPNFATFATTARKYDVAFWIFLQSVSQLESRYGHHEAKTIIDGLQTEIYLSGMGIETAEILARRLGRRRRNGQSDWRYGDENLMNPDEIISMDDDEALLLHSNRRPFRYRVTPFYKQWWMRKASNNQSYPLFTVQAPKCDIIDI